LGFDPDWEPTQVDPNLMGDRDAVLNLRIEGGLLSGSELLEELTKLVVAQQAQIKSLTEKVETLTSKGSKKS
jgi:hypothetical protein